MPEANDHFISSIEQLEALYGPPAPASLTKVTHRIIPEYAQLINASPFVALASNGPAGVDCSPRGDRPGFVRIHDDTTLLMPDRRGNNRADSLRNIVQDPRVAFLFLIPGAGITLRVNGQARLSVDPELCSSFAVDTAQPRCVIVLSVEEVYFQCAWAIVRSKLWDSEAHTGVEELPTAGQILQATSKGSFDGETYDRDWPDRAQQTMW